MIPRYQVIKYYWRRNPKLSITYKQGRLTTKILGIKVFKGVIIKKNLRASDSCPFSLGTLLFRPIDTYLIPDPTPTPTMARGGHPCLTNHVSSIPDLVLPTAEHLGRLVLPMRGEENSSW